MDCRVKPGNDNGWFAASREALPRDREALPRDRVEHALEQLAGDVAGLSVVDAECCKGLVRRQPAEDLEGRNVVDVRKVLEAAVERGPQLRLRRAVGLDRGRELRPAVTGNGDR